MRLYHHKTDGGAEYLCSEAVWGTDEGSMNSQILGRDGLIRIIHGPGILGQSVAY